MLSNKYCGVWYWATGNKVIDLGACMFETPLAKSCYIYRDRLAFDEKKARFLKCAECYEHEEEISDVMRELSDENIRE